MSKITALQTALPSASGPMLTLSLSCLVLASLLGGLGLAGELPETVRELRITEATFNTSSAPGNSSTRSVQLPYRWSCQPQQCATAWFELDLTSVPPGASGYTLFIPRLSATATLLINGQPVDGVTPRERLLENHRYLPMTFYFPSYHLNTGSDRLHLAVATGGYATGWLSEVYLGPAGLLAAPAARIQRLAELPAQFAVLLSGILGCLFLLVWLRDRKEQSYLGFACCSLLAALYLSGLAIYKPWPNQALWSYMQLLALLSTMALLPATLLLPLSNKLLKLWYAITLALFTVLTWVLLTDQLPAAALPLNIALHGMFCVLIILGQSQGVLMVLPASSRLVTLMLCAAAALQFAIYGASGVRQLPLLLPWAAAIALILVAWALLTRFINEFRESEVLNQKLQFAVEEKTREIASQFSQIASLERSKALAHERNRIMRDMHDGVGGQLVSAVAMLETGNATPALIATNLREALDDMRFVIDSLDPTIDDVGTVLGTLRERLQPRLSAAGIELIWDAGWLEHSPPLSPADTLQLLRILQEATTNAIKHSGATQVRISASSDAAGTALLITDNGCGEVDLNAGTAHRGITNMHKRATALGGQLEFTGTSTGTEKGTTVKLWLPAVKHDEDTSESISANQQTNVAKHP